MPWVNIIYYYLIICLGDQGLNFQDHLLRPGSPLISANTHCADRRDTSQFAARFAGTLTLERW